MLCDDADNKVLPHHGLQSRLFRISTLSSTFLPIRTERHTSSPSHLLPQARATPPPTSQTKLQEPKEGLTDPPMHVSH